MPTGSSAEYVVHRVVARPPTTVAQQVKPQQRPVLFCSICLDSARDVAVTPCGHVFCYMCHMQCAERRSMYRCAVCRAEVRVSQVRTRMPVLNAMITEAIAYAERNNVAMLSDVRAMLPCVMAMMATVQQQVGVEKVGVVRLMQDLLSHILDHIKE
ncbi:RING-finger-containing E3 ubiquitin ligase [Rock bream iridovirus]|uniref:RING-finger-containing E3 ubiquitin ligase n=1 Tax=Rock bream iridovirus TaxID=263891 RepID=Q5YF26_ISKNV|nr:RING-finger-containing E3 ubiquitin ligase [Rock bream iridovirus]